MNKLVSTIIIVFLVFFSSSNADILNVPSGMYPTIQAGIDSASNGDTVLVMQGIYIPDMFFRLNKTALTLASHFILDEDTSYISSTIIDGNNSNQGIIIGADSISLIGFTIQNCSGSFGSALRCGSVGNINITHNIFKNNFSGSLGNITFSGESCYAKFASNQVIGNYSDDDGGGICVLNWATVLIYNNLIKGNTTISDGGGIYMGSGGSHEVSGNIIVDNVATSCGAGIFYTSLAGATIISNNIIANNSCEVPLWGIGDGGGIYIKNTWLVFFVNNTVFGNKANLGGGAYLHSSCSIIANSIFWSNSSEEGNSQIYIYNNWSPLFVNSDIQDSLWGAGCISEDPRFVDELNNDFHLLGDSPCIDAGIDSAQNCGNSYFTPLIDIDGNPRPTGLKPDLGAYESIDPSIIEKRLSPNKQYYIRQNYPNPFNPNTTIEFTLQKKENVKIEVFNLLGQKIETLFNKSMLAGSHEIEFTANDLPSGVYLYRISSGKFQQTKKMILLR